MKGNRKMTNIDSIRVANGYAMAGDKVSHELFGLGTVVSCLEEPVELVDVKTPKGVMCDVICINFASHPDRVIRLNPSFVKLV